jgi:chemotaxis protein MotB
MKRMTIVILSLFTMSYTFSSCVSNKKYRAARDSNADLVRQNERLNGNLRTAQDSITMLKGDVGVLSDVYKSTNEELSSSKEQMAEQQRKLQQLQSLINQQRNNTEALRKKISDALLSFSSSELSVSMKNGKVYVSMQESLLFPSGSATVNQKGRDALARVAGVLNINPDINVEIEGHTDSIPIKNKMYVDNWALSTARATAIARVMIDEYVVDPARITASGRGEYDPIAPNTTPEGRGQNRRTEIILEPKLDELMQLIRGADAPGRR